MQPAFSFATFVVTWMVYNVICIAIPYSLNFGTSEQTEIIEDYQMSTDDEKLLVPYIERMNGNICVAKSQFEDSVKHYNKGLLSLRMLFEMEQPVVKD